MTYRPRIDMLRALAIAGVLFAHLWKEESTLGSLGVRLFFVVSGYLISTILIGIRNDYRASSGARLVHIRNFFVRRALRLWPAYFAVLTLAILANVQGIRSTALWHALFLSNVLFAIRNDYVPWVTAPWWSLSIEEQFYLLWPAAMLLLKRKWLPWLIAAVIVTGIAWDLCIGYSGISPFGAYFLPPAAFPALGAGAGLALLHDRRGYLPRVVDYVGLAGLPALAACTFIPGLGALWTVASVLPMVGLVAWSIRGPSETPAVLKPVLWVGRVSYGIYLYHSFIFAAFLHIGKSPLDHRGPIMFIAVSIATVMLASLSWLLLEEPCSRLKRYFPY